MVKRAQSKLWRLQSWGDGTLRSYSEPTDNPSPQTELPPFNTRTPTKYVSLTGSVNGQPAFTTMQAAVETAVPGDVIAIAPGTYPHGFTITTSGTPENRIYIQALDPNNPPLIDGENIRPGNWEYGVKNKGSAFIRVAASYVTVDSINMVRSNRNFLLVGPWNNNGAFLFSEDINRYYYGVEVLRCSMKDSYIWGVVYINTFDSVFGGNEVVYTCRNQLVDISKYGNPLTWGAAVLIFGRRVRVLENVIGQVLGEGIHFGQHIDWDPRPWAELYDPVSDLYVTPQEIQATDCIIRGNELFDCYSGVIYVTSVEGGVIENNLIYNSNDTYTWYWDFDPVTKVRIRPSFPYASINIGNEGAVNRGVSAAPPTKFIGSRNLTIRNNVMFNGQRVFYFANWPRNATNNIKVQNNTIFRGAILPGQYEESLVYNGQSNLTYLTFENNLIFDPRGRAATTWNATPNSVYRNNLFSSTPAPTMNGANNIVNFNVGIQNTAYSVAAAPYPNRPTFDRNAFKLLPGSPAIGAGFPNGITTDFFGNPRSPTSMDIGACAAP